MISDCRKDILIMWDNSASIGFNHFLNILKFLKELIKKLNVSPDGTHLGFLTFSSEGKTKKLLDVGKIQDPTRLSDWLDDFISPYVFVLQGDYTYTGKAFEIANEVSVPFACTNNIFISSWNLSKQNSNVHDDDC